MMRRDEPAVIMTREEHVTHLMDFWRQKRIDEISAEILYDDLLRSVQLSMLEPEPPRMNLPNPGAWLLAALFWFGITGTFYMVFR